MRLWTLSPGYLDAKGLVAAWREGLLALAVLSGKTKGYLHHPQLDRFRAAVDPEASLYTYLKAIADEADRRGYRFDRARLAANGSGSVSGNPGSQTGSRPKGNEGNAKRRAGVTIPVSSVQIAYEAALLLYKLEKRDPERARILAQAAPGSLALNPAFRAAEGAVPPGAEPGGIAPWERPIPEVLARMGIGR